jgi:hypothetical protein
MATCPNGHSNPSEYIYCGQCGALMAVSPSSAPAAQPWRPSAGPPPASQIWTASGTSRPPRGWRAWPVAVKIGAIVGLLVVITGVALAIGSSRDIDNSDTSDAEDAGSQAFPSSFALPSQVDRSLTKQFRNEGHTVEYPHCTYFAPNLGPPPVYDCAFKIDGIWHDNIQGTGHPDGTFSWQDDTSGVPSLN